ncbi:MAG TPA: glycosyltransferase family 9 protein [Vicinamibacterales bacterium]|nr:glycosyltransferase family 9 protein [Vicinamibacterales bacterium]
MTKFLLVRLGALGDIVHAIPVAVALRRAYPDARIDWMVSGKHREMLDLVPVIDHTLVVNDRGDASGGVSPGAAILAARRVRYDVAIDMQGLLKSAVIARLSGATRVIGFNAKYARESLARWFYTDVHDPGGAGLYAPSETRHVVAINLGLLAPLGILASAPEFRIDAPRSAAVIEVIGRANGPFALLNTGAAWPNKRWPAARLAELAVALRARHHMQSIVLWGPGERDLADVVTAAADGAALLAPPTTIADVAALASAAAVMVSGDTGPTHIASAMGTPLVGIYGPTRPERNGPLGADDVTVSRAAVCECHHLRQCRRDRMCLLDIDVAEVLDAVERRLAARERGRG